MLIEKINNKKIGGHQMRKIKLTEKDAKKFAVRLKDEERSNVINLTQLYNGK